MENYISCLYCGGSSILAHQGVFHPFNCHHGPFNIYKCKSCGSAQTYPLPTIESLNELYQSYVNGLPNMHRVIMEQDPQTAIHKWCIERVKTLFEHNSNSKFSWLEVGAGGGELSEHMAEAFPKSNGIAVDLHPSPLSKHKDIIEWRQINLNTEAISKKLPLVDLIVSVGVWEHVLNPGNFVQDLLRLLKPNGSLYLLCPNNTSIASRILGSNWPLFIPGEHITIPTKIGAKKLFRASGKNLI